MKWPVRLSTTKFACLRSVGTCPEEIPCSSWALAFFLHALWRPVDNDESAAGDQGLPNRVQDPLGNSELMVRVQDRHCVDTASAEAWVVKIAEMRPEVVFSVPDRPDPEEVKERRRMSSVITLPLRPIGPVSLREKYPEPHPRSTTESRSPGLSA